MPKEKEDPIAKAFYLIVGIFVLFNVVKALIQSDPSFAKYGWSIIGALVFGLIIYFRKKLFQ